MFLKHSFLFLYFSIALCAHIRYRKRLHMSDIDLKQICSKKGPNEFFRLNAEHDCREVFQCSESGLVPLRCPIGLVFDIEKQICDWPKNVNNCKQLQQTKLKMSHMTRCKDGSRSTMCENDNDPNRATYCDKETCKLPDCYCSKNGHSIPNDLPLESVPQLIMITFDDAINNNNIDIYNELFRSDRQNPNGCSIKGTFFVSHKYTNYSAVQEFHRLGHEIAVHSITHNSNEEYWSNGTIDDWAKEMAGARVILERFANITDNSIVGIRAPLLKIGGNNQFEMMERQGFLYDSSIGAPLSNFPQYPYTLHHRIPHKCHGNFQKCPTRSYPVWEIPMNEYDRRENPNDIRLSGCVMVDQCSNLITGDLLYNFLENNFERHYNSNRAPLGLYFHASWLLNQDFLDALSDWIDEKLKMKNIYFTTMTQVIRWMQDPTPLNDINKFEPFLKKCKVEYAPSCSIPNQCPLTSQDLPGETIRLHSCLPCDDLDVYPWIDQPTGEYNIPEVDNELDLNSTGV